MDKEIRRIVYLLFLFTLCVVWLTAYFTAKYYEEKYSVERKNAEIAYYKAIFERDTYASMYYEEIGNEEMAKKFNRLPNTFEKEK